MSVRGISGAFKKGAPLASVAPVPYLTNIMVGNMMSEAVRRKFVGRLLCPMVKVDALAFKYLNFDLGPWFKRKAKKIASGNTGAASDYPVVDFSGSWVDATVDIWGARAKTPRHQMNLPNQPVPTEETDAKLVGAVLELEREYQVLSTVLATSTWKGNGGAATDFAGAASSAYSSNQIAYADASGADSVMDFDELCRLVSIQTGGLRPNVAVIGAKVARSLGGQSAFKNRVGGGQLAKTVVDQRFIAEVLAGIGIEKVFIPQVSENTGSDESPTMAAMGGSSNWDKMVWLGYVSQSPAVNEPSALYNFYCDAIVPGMTEEGAFVESFYDDDDKHLKTDGTACFKPTRTSLTSGILVTGATQN